MLLGSVGGVPGPVRGWAPSVSPSSLRPSVSRQEAGALLHGMGAAGGPARLPGGSCPLRGSHRWVQPPLSRPPEPGLCRWWLRDCPLLVPALLRNSRRDKTPGARPLLEIYSASGLLLASVPVSWEGTETPGGGDRAVGDGGGGWDGSGAGESFPCCPGMGEEDGVSVGATGTSWGWGGHGAVEGQCHDCRDLQSQGRWGVGPLDEVWDLQVRSWTSGSLDEVWDLQVKCWTSA